MLLQWSRRTLFKRAGVFSFSHLFPWAKLLNGASPVLPQISPYPIDYAGFSEIYRTFLSTTSWFHARLESLVIPRHYAEFYLPQIGYDNLIDYDNPTADWVSIKTSWITEELVQKYYSFLKEKQDYSEFVHLLLRSCPHPHIPFLGEDLKEILQIRMNSLGGGLPFLRSLARERAVYPGSLLKLQEIYPALQKIFPFDLFEMSEAQFIQAETILGRRFSCSYSDYCQSRTRVRDAELAHDRSKQATEKSQNSSETQIEIYLYDRRGGMHQSFEDLA